MKVTVLGCGSAYGVPVVGGDWGDCNPENPKNRRTAPSILIEKGETKLLVDMGPDYREQAEKHKVRDVDGVFFTHPHADHVTGMFHLPMMMRYFQDKNLPLYMDRFTRKEIEKNWWFQFDPKINVEYSGPGRPYLVEIIEYWPFTVGDITALPMYQQHGKMHSMGLRIDDFAYSTDVCAMPERTFEKLEGVKTWIVECNCEFNTDKSHSFLEQTLGWIDRIKPEKAYLTHLDLTMDYDRISAQLPENVELAYDGLEIVL